MRKSKEMSWTVEVKFEERILPTMLLVSSEIDKSTLYDLMKEVYKPDFDRIEEFLKERTKVIWTNVDNSFKDTVEDVYGKMHGVGHPGDCVSLTVKPTMMIEFNDKEEAALFKLFFG